MNDCLYVFVGGTLFVVLQGSAEVMEDDIPASHTVGLKQVFCKQYLRSDQIKALVWRAGRGNGGGGGGEMVGGGRGAGGGCIK